MITVGITAYKCHLWLQEAIDSLINQSSLDWEGVLVLDCKADEETKQIFNKFNHSKFTKYVSDKNHGPFINRSKAIELAKTEWYFQLDGDDLLPPKSIEIIIETIKTNPNVKYIYGNCEHFSEKKSFIKRPIKDSDALCYGPLFNAASPITKSLYYEIGGYSKGLFINADWDFWISVYENNIIGKYINQVLYKRRERDDNVGSTHIKLRPEIIETIIDKHPNYFSKERRRKLARYKVHEQLARYFRSIGKRSDASKYANLALEYGETTSTLNEILNENEMSMFRYGLRRLGRLF